MTIRYGLVLWSSTLLNLVTLSCQGKPPDVPRRCESDGVDADVWYRTGVKLCSQQQYAECIDAFKRSDCLDHQHLTALNIGQAQELAQLYGSAWKTYMKLWNERAEPKSEYQLRAYGRASELDLKQFVPQLKLVVPPSLSRIPGLEIFVDGVRLEPVYWNLAAPVDPGVRSLVVLAPGRVAWTGKTNALQGNTTTSITLPSDLEYPPLPKPRIAALAIGGTGIAMGVAAIVMSSIAWHKSSSADDTCKTFAAGHGLDPEGENTCKYAGSYEVFLSRAQAMKEDAHDFSIAGTTLGIVSTAFLGTAAILWVTAPAAKKDAAFQFLPIVAPHYAGAAAQFTF